MDKETQRKLSILEAQLHEVNVCIQSIEDEIEKLEIFEIEDAEYSEEFTLINSLYKLYFEQLELERKIEAIRWQSK